MALRSMVTCKNLQVEKFADSLILAKREILRPDLGEHQHFLLKPDEPQSIIARFPYG